MKPDKLVEQCLRLKPYLLNLLDLEKQVLKSLETSVDEDM